MAWEEETKRHAQTFNGLIKFTKYSVVLVIVILILMATFLT